MVERDADSLADEVCPAGRDPVDPRARLADELVAHLRDGQEHDGGGGPETDQDERRPAPPRDRHGDHDAGRQGDEARLREGDEEAEPGRDDHGVEPGDPPAAHASQQDPGERGEDRHGQVAPVDRRVPEHRVHAEERRVGVEDLHARVPEHVPRHPLVAADGGVGERRPDEPAPEPGQPAPAPGQAREADREQPERQQERAEEDRPAVHVDGPEHREARPRRRTPPPATPPGRARAARSSPRRSDHPRESASPPITA